MAEQPVGRGGLLELTDVDAGPSPSRPHLRGVSFTLSAGEIAVVLGGNGAGKTTLLRTAAGILPPRRGTIRGPEPGGFDPRYSGLILEEPPSQFVSGTARGEIEFALENLGWSRERIRERTRALITGLDLDALADRDPRTLSAGEQERCLIAAALGPGPRVLFLDDPFLHMEPGLSRPLWHRLREEVCSGGVGAILLAAHDAELAATADTVGILDGGTLAAWGPPEFVLRGPLPDGVAQPIGVWLEHRLRARGWELGGRDLDVDGLVRRIRGDLGR